MTDPVISELEAIRAEQELLPCPFCGGEALLDHNTQGREYWEGFCPTCDFGAQDRPEKVAAIKAWNTRHA